MDSALHSFYKTNGNKIPYRVGPVSLIFSLPKQTELRELGVFFHLTFALDTGELLHFKALSFLLWSAEHKWKLRSGQPPLGLSLFWRNAMSFFSVRENLNVKFPTMNSIEVVLSNKRNITILQ